MKKCTLYLTLLTFVAVFLFTSCEKEETYQGTDYYTPEEYAALTVALNIPNQQINYSVILPAHAVGKPAAISNDLSLLGRVLFFDQNLSKNRTVSCASCHRQELAFADDKAFSTGFDGAVTSRNSLALGVSLGFENSYENESFANNKPAGFLWDERADDIHSQSKITLLDSKEMGMPSMEEVVKRVNEQPHYAVLFKRAFGTDEVQAWRVLKSIEGFVNSLASTHSRFDEGMNKAFDVNKDFANYTQMENMGKQLYEKNCSACHGTQMIGLQESMANNGLDLAYADAGRQGHTGNEQDRAIFKVPMLRNIALTAPYMHDGRFATLEEVVEHYNSGIKMHPNLHSNLRDEKDYTKPKQMNMTAEEKQALVAFLQTLTDETFISDPRFSNPFKY